MRFWTMAASWLRLVALMLLLVPSLARNIPRAGKCTSLNRRKSWNTLTRVEKTEYLQAERCLMNHAPIVGNVKDAKNLWDELHDLHISQGNYVHYVGHFLPWHRYLVRAHEVLLQTLCGYKGAHPYWDEVTDYEAGPLQRSSIFDPVVGFGGNGFGRNRCIQNGPFKDTTLRIRSNERNGEYCLSRAFNQTAFAWANRRNIEECFALQKYTDAWECYNQYPHAAGHIAVGGVMEDPTESNGDPLFYLHHAYLDRLWWRWQQADLPGRLSDMGGPNVVPPDLMRLMGMPPVSAALLDYNGDHGGETTLAHVLWMNGLVPNVTVAEVMDIGGQVVCAEYVD
ncbi:tyrosinase family protein [Aspergillus foveolatus]|uniref:tyrosinase family protein n=1 Tax=Aspergillus foveolatus TaxID=210207 RepID=UPI003CCCBECD